MSPAAMTPADAFLDLFDRMPGLVDAAVDGLTVDQLAHRPTPEANSIAWLVWHLARVEDDHISGAAEALGMAEFAGQAYVEGGFSERFDLPFEDSAIGYGQSSEEVGRVRADAELLREYYAAVHARTERFLRALDGGWDRVVDERWDPPVTLLVRLSSVVNDVTQHVGQAAYVRGLLGEE